MSETGFIRPITLSEAASSMARSLGLRWPDDRDEIVHAVNLYREALFNEFPRFQLFDSAAYCMCLQNFCRGCGCSTCNCRQRTGYRGFTLPRGQESVSQAWACGAPVTTMSRWRTLVSGLTPNPKDLLQVIPEGYSPVEQDLTHPSKLTLTCIGNGNQGVTIRVSGTEQYFGDPVTELFSAEAGGESKEEFQRIQEVVIKGALTSPAILSAGNRELARYVPGDSVPQYRRYRVAVPCTVDQIYVRLIGKYEPIHFDDDIVEIGSPLVMENFATWIRYRHAKNRTEQTTAALALTRAMQQLGGIVDRHRGANREQLLHSVPPRRMSKMRRAGLYGRDD